MNDRNLKICVASDLHLEFYEDWKPRVPLFDKDCRLIVLAGDIATGSRFFEAVEEVACRHPEADVAVVAGNHEFYDYEYHERLTEIRSELGKMNRVHFMENDVLDIQGYHILGCTLWTGFDILSNTLSDVSKDYCRHSIADFEAIGYDGRCLDPDDITLLYENSRYWLKQQLSMLNCEKCIVISHFPPCEEVSHPGFGLSATTNYFQANCLDIIERYQPALWVYGHNHWSQDMRIGKTRLYSNQLGYPSEQYSIPSFSLRPIVE